MIAKIQTISPGGAVITFETDVMKLEALIENLPRIEERLEEAGYDILNTTPAAAGHSVVTVTGSQNAFAARELVCEVLDKKPYWKVMGPPPFHKFGLRVWPETLEAAGIEVEQVNILDGLDLAGYTAYWEFRNNGKGGQMRTVVNLSK